MAKLPAVQKPLFLALGALLSQVSFAQDPAAQDAAAQDAASESVGSNLMLEEVKVTAQKREESLQDVPLSVAAVSGDKLDEAGIENVEDLTTLVPNLHLTETGISTQLRVRGIGSDNSQGFEQSVGMYIDGVYHGRAQLFRAPFFDLERVEVLRGPQSTLFGKNSIAGALNLTTAKPTEELEGQLSASYEFEHEQQELNGVISGPITDELRGRLALRTYQDEGYIWNDYKSRWEAEQDEQAARATLDWTPTDKLSFMLMAEQSEFEVYGRQFEITLDQPNENTGLTYGEYLQLFSGISPENYESDLDYVRHTNAPETSDNNVSKTILTTNYELGDNTLTLVSGWLEFDYYEQCDCDYTAANVFTVDLEEDYEQFSQEIRITSPGGETVDWLAGAFYQEWDQTYRDVFEIDENSVLIPALSVAAPTLPTGMIANTGDIKDFQQSSETWAVFAQGTWNISPQWHLTLGGRYTEEDKSAQKTMNIIDIETGEPLNNPMLGLMFLNIFKAETEQGPGGHDVSGSRSEKKFTPLVTLEYDLSQNTMLYGSYTKGFKAGGFDPRSNNKSYFEFDEESAEAYELGAKSTFAGGRGEVNLALYRTDYEDLQISQFDGGVGFNVGNAEETRVQGLELDGRWLLHERLSASYGVAWLDFEYLSFENGNCYADEPGARDHDDDPSTPATCDYTGREGVYTPDYTVNLTLDYNQPVFNNWMLLGSLDVQQIDEQQVHTNLDPQGTIDAQTLVSARLALDGGNWTLALLGKNLLDEKAVSYSANAPLSDSSFDTNTHYSFVKRPRTVALEATYRF